MNTKLNSNGIRQAQLLASNFPIADFSLIYSSDLARAYETCRTIVLQSPHSQGLSEEVIQTDRRLRARNFGSLEGKPVDRLLFQALGQGAGKTVTDFTPEGAETTEVQKRVLEFLEQRLVPEVAECLESLDDQQNETPNILVVTHAVVISEIIAYFESFGHHSFLKRGDQQETMRTPNTSVSQFLVHYEATPIMSHSAGPRIVLAECFQSHGVGHL